MDDEHHFKLLVDDEALLREVRAVASRHDIDRPRVYGLAIEYAGDGALEAPEVSFNDYVENAIKA